MKIKRLHIENFGNLSDFDQTFRDDCNYFLRENGWGKTTLSVFIRVMFYGFPTKGERAADRERYRPWKEGIYGGQLTFSTEEAVYTVFRTFGRSKSGKDDSCYLIEERSRKQIPLQSFAIGEGLFGINEESFVNSIWMGQDHGEMMVGSDLASRIGNSSDLMADVKRYDAVTMLIDRHLNRLTPDRKTGLISRKQMEKDEIEISLSGEHSVNTALEELGRKREGCRTTLSKLAEEQRQLQKLQQDFSEWQDYMGQKDYYDTLQKEYLRRDEIWETYLKKYPNGIPEEEYREGKTEKQPAIVFSGIGILILLAAILLFKGNPESSFLLPAALLGLGLILSGLVGTAKKDAKEKGDSSLFFEILNRQREREAAQSAWQELQRAEANLRDFHQKYPDFEKQAEIQIPETLRDRLTLAELNQRMQELLEQIQKTQNEIRQYSNQMEDLQNTRSELTLQSEKYDRISAELEELKKDYHLTELTRRFLGEARDAISCRYLQTVQESFAAYYGILDPDRKELLYVDSDYCIHVMGGGLPHGSEALSSGYRELAALCLRLALVDAMYEREAPFLIMDDPFVYLDEEKTERAKQLLKVVSDKYQMICFACK